MKKAGKLILFLALTTLGIALSNCKGSKTSNNNFVFESNPPFSIKSAYFQKWMAGTKAGGSGINIYIEVDALEDDPTFQHLYFQNRILDIQKSSSHINTYTAHLDLTSRKNSRIMSSDPLEEAHNTPSDKFPFQLEKDEAVISYWYKGKRSYYKIDRLSEKEEIAYPQAPPQR